MLNHDLFKQLVLLTPSRITTEERYNFSCTSINSLRKCLKDARASHIVVHDSPGLKKLLPRRLHKLSRQLYWDSKAKDIYETPELIWLEGEGKGSASALLMAVNTAISEGKIYGFIHLDDHVYCDEFSGLLVNGLLAMEQYPDLLWTRFSGYPLIFKDKSKITFNGVNQIAFDGVILYPHRHTHYTVWSSPLNMEVNSGKYWPIVMWFCIYRLSFLKTILEWSINKGAKHLAQVELYYKNRGGFQRILDSYLGCSFGYINMQFGGIEMHRNHNWKELLSMENTPIK